MILLANGLFPTHPVALQPLLQAEVIVCCDGAFKKLLDFGLTRLCTTDITIVGDGDSLPPDIKTRFSDRFIRIAPVKQSGRWGCIDHTGRFVVTNQFNSSSEAYVAARQWAEKQKF